MKRVLHVVLAIAAIALAAATSVVSAAIILRPDIIELVLPASLF